MLTPRQRQVQRRRRIQKRHKDGTSDYVCYACGDPFLSRAQRDGRAAIGGLVVTMHTGPCDLCHEVKSVLHIRFFNYLQKREE